MDSITGLFKEANFLNENGKREEAAVKFTRFIEETQKYFENNSATVMEEEMRERIALAYNNRGFLHYLNVDFDDAIKDYTESIKFNSRLIFPLYNRGLIHYRLERFDQAIEDMKAVLLIDPNFESAKECLKQSIADKKYKEDKIHLHNQTVS